MEVKSEKNSFVFNSDSISYKSVSEDGKRKFYIQGYISTSDLDSYNDIVTENAMESMLKQINERQITIDYDHEAWRDDNSILPVGKIVEAKMDDTGLWVKCELNKSSPKFKALWGSIKDGFVNAFSIAFKPLKATVEMINDVKVRLLDDLILLNVALTGAPVNQSAIMTDFSMKSVILKSIQEVDNMAEDNTEAVLNQPVEDEAPEAKSEEQEVEEKAEEKVEEKSEPAEAPKEEVEAKSEAASNEDAVAKLAAELKSLREESEAKEKELRAEIKSLKETEVFKAKAESVPEVKSEEDKRSVLSML